MNKSREILNKYWGFDDFRPLQGKIVESILYGHDTLAILPTGGGKSICYQVPAMATNGTTLVISPLIALMEDQVNTLRKKNIRAELITSTMSFREIDIALDNARFGETKFLYTSPERLKSPLFMERFKLMDINLIAVDEAHCISEWGHDFRPAYREIAEIRAFHPDVPLIALTASATDRVKEDIIKELELKSPQIFKGDLTRGNIKYSVQPSQSKLNRITDFCIDHGSESGIIYCQTRKNVKNVAQHLRSNAINAGFYHGGLNPDERKYMLEQWLSDNLPVMVATNAFGMGIDKPDVKFVLHFEVPNNLEAYYQEAGRAGRDGNAAQAIAFWEQEDLDKMKDMLRLRYPEIQRVKEIYQWICNHLKIAYGSGFQETYELNLTDFHNHYKTSYSETYYSLKILEIAGILSFTENQFHPTRLKFVVGSSALYKFQIAHENAQTLISLLSRSYPGIFDHFISIHETKLAERLKISENELQSKLKYLEQYGIIDISWKSNLPKVTFLVERLQPENFSLTNEAYHKRQQIELEKLSAIINYLKTSECRQVVINTYFGETSEPCGICDNCLTNSREDHSMSELLEIIPTLLPSKLETIINKLNTNKNSAERALHKLILEEKVVYKDEMFHLNN